MTDNDFKNIEDIQRILKYLDQGKLDYTLWPNALKLKVSLDKLIDEHKEYMDHMKHHHWFTTNFANIIKYCCKTGSIVRAL